MQGGTAAVERVFREEYGRLIASLVRRFGDIDIAEEAAGKALLAALEKWPDSGGPANPGGWLTITAGNRAIDAIRREKQRDAKHQVTFMYFDDTPQEPTGAVEDDRLRLLFTCCHPGLAREARTVGPSGTSEPITSEPVPSPADGARFPDASSTGWRVHTQIWAGANDPRTASTRCADRVHVQRLLKVCAQPGDCLANGVPAAANSTKTVTSAHM